MLKRDKLKDIYSMVNGCLRQMDDVGISALNGFFENRDISKLFEEHKDRLEKKDYSLLVAGKRNVFEPDRRLSISCTHHAV
jgi:hypothetical protein